MIALPCLKVVICLNWEVTEKLKIKADVNELNQGNRFKRTAISQQISIVVL